MNKDQAAAIAKEIVRAWDFDETDMPIKSSEQGGRLEKAIAEALLEASAGVEVSEEELKDKGEIFASWWVRVGEKENYHYSQAVSVWSAACEAVHAGYRYRDEIKRRGSEGGA